MKRISLKWIVPGFVIGVLFCSQPIFSTTYYNDITTVGTSAEMIGIGGVEGFSHQASVLIENPAGLGYAGNSLSGFYTTTFADTQYMAGAVSVKPFQDVVLGVAVAYQKDSNLDHTDTTSANEAHLLGTFTMDRLQVVTGVDYCLFKAVHIGSSWVQYVSNQLEVRGYGMDMAIGVQYHGPFVGVSLSGKNIFGNSIRYNDGTQEKLSTQWGVGFKTMPLSVMDLEVFGEIKTVSHLSAPVKNLGVRFYPLNDSNFGVSLGYREKTDVVQSKGTMTAGVILKFHSFSFEYAYDTTDVYQNSSQHYFSVSGQY